MVTIFNGILPDILNMKEKKNTGDLNKQKDENKSEQTTPENKVQKPEIEPTTPQIEDKTKNNPAPLNDDENPSLNWDTLPAEYEIPNQSEDNEKINPQEVKQNLDDGWNIRPDDFQNDLDVLNEHDAQRCKKLL